MWLGAAVSPPLQSTSTIRTKFVQVKKEKEMPSKINKTGSFLTGMLFGSLIGGTIALLFAPQSGEDTRTVIKEKSLEIKDKAVETGEEIRHKAEEVAQKTRERIEEAAEATREQAQELQQRSQTFVDTQRERIKGAIEAGKSSLSRSEKSAIENGVKSDSA
jgi:gas vesicle protein